VTYIRSFLNRESAGQLVKLAIIGVANTAVHFTVLNVFLALEVGGLIFRASVAFTVATAVSYLLNRRWTFQIKHGEGLLRETIPFFGINLVALAITIGVVAGADAFWGPLDPLAENLANLVAGFLILLPKLAGYRDLVFRRSLAVAAPHAEPQADGVPPHLPEGPGGDTAP
jgi:putative flippase GtrA